jgi:hypothetical protein
MSTSQKKDQTSVPPISSASKFMSLLQKNRLKDSERKQQIQQNHYRRTKSNGNSKPPQIIPGGRNDSDDKQQTSYASVSRTIYLRKTPSQIPDDHRLKLRLNFKQIKNKFALDSKRSYHVANPSVPNPQTERGASSGVFRVTNKKFKGRNFCDMFATSDPKINQREEPIERPSSILEVISSEPSLENFGEEICKKKILERKALSSHHESPSKNNDQDDIRRKYQSVLVQRKSNIQPRSSHLITEITNTIDSAFLNQFFKVKQELFNGQITALLNTSQVGNEINNLVNNNYTSYWMMSIEEILAGDVNEVIQHGYYRFKQIGMGRFRVISLIEEIKYRIEQDIIREQFLLFRSRKRQPKFL